MLLPSLDLPVVGDPPVQVDELTDVDETRDLAEGTFQQSAPGAAGSGYVDDNGRLPGLAGNAGSGGAGVRCCSIGPSQRGHGYPHVGYFIALPLEELYCASRPMWCESA